MNPFLVGFFLLLSPSLVVGQFSNPDENWKTFLGDIKLEPAGEDLIDALTYVAEPEPGPTLKKMIGETVVIRGFYIPMDLTDTTFVISYTPFATCFFCGGGGVETVIQLECQPNEATPFQNLEVDTYVEVTGQFRLNTQLGENLLYILDDAKLKRIIR